MNYSKVFLCSLLVLFVAQEVQSLRRCIRCRSRGELGTCGDPFPKNVTETVIEEGLYVEECPSGWCGKIVEDDGAATERMCLRGAPSDNEERCARTMWNRKKVYMCFCKGDLCNSAVGVPAT